MASMYVERAARLAFPYCADDDRRGLWRLSMMLKELGESLSPSVVGWPALPDYWPPDESEPVED